MSVLNTLIAKNVSLSLYKYSVQEFCLKLFICNNFTMEDIYKSNTSNQLFRRHLTSSEKLNDSSEY